MDQTDKASKLELELKAYRDRQGIENHPDYTRNRDRGFASSTPMPLVHGVGSNKEVSQILTDGRLHCREDLSRNTLSHQLMFGTERCVYFALSVLYPARKAAFIFSSECEAPGTTTATPWDSGAFFYAASNRKMTDTQAAELFQQYNLPAPDYRRYAGNYITTWFGDLDSYLSGARPHNRCRDTWHYQPLNNKNNDVIGRVFEVRIRESVPCNNDHLLAIVFPTKPPLDVIQLVRTKPELKRVELDFPGQEQPRRDQLSTHVYDWVKRYLNERVATQSSGGHS